MVILLYIIIVNTNQIFENNNYDNIKDEVLLNAASIKITIQDWNYTLRKSKKLLNSWICKSSRNKQNKQIELKEIITIKLYTDFDKLQYELKKSFRISSYDNDNNNNHLYIRELLINYYYQRKSLISTI